MNPSLEQFGLRVMSGEARGVGPMVLRGALALVEPLYAGAMVARNRAYDTGMLKRHALPRPVVSVGNLTAGGTGKTPMVRWLAEQLIARGKRPAVLLRGYGKPGAMISDEQQLLQGCLDGVAVVAHPDRSAGAAAAIERQPQTDLFVLDDAFQHRKVARNFDLVLVNAAEPFGFGHVHPRGLLREPIGGLARAHAIILTRCDAVETTELQRIEGVIRSITPDLPLLRTVHALTGLRRATTPASAPADEEMATLRGRTFFSFSGIGSPRSFHEQLVRAGARPVGSRAFPDHHEYTEADVAALSRDATAAGAELLLTTEKDWVKLAQLSPARECSPPILRVEVRIRFQQAADEPKLLEMIEQRLARAPQRVT
ncbi:MAG TPA: tetraacyldisaccharide 4'-kinase [Tepidisphaeraceae bacterium]|nr:tetraacyldisaccharide 4'-kinase [Tepidisphaeraceae bacterium]